MRRPRGLSAVLALGLGLLATMGAAPSAAASTDPGCQGLAAPVAHRGGGQALASQPGGAPQACGVATGFAAAESHIVAMNDGAIVFTPAVLPSGAIGTGEPAPVDPDTQGNASPAAVAVTTDDGGHWSAVKPFDTTWNPTDHGDYVDASTGRLFFEDYGPIPQDPKFGASQEGPAHIMWTDDRTTWHHSVISNLVLPENRGSLSPKRLPVIRSRSGTPTSSTSAPTPTSASRAPPSWAACASALSTAATHGRRRHSCSRLWAPSTPSAGQAGRRSLRSTAITPSPRATGIFTCSWRAVARRTSLAAPTKGRRSRSCTRHRAR